MKKLSRILTMCLCAMPVVNVGAWGAVATTAGHNLTAYNPSNLNSNQWAAMTNVRDNSVAQPAARADFGNCNAVVMRCATPKCANGGCVDANVATAIVAGCVQSNEICAQYGNELVAYMSAQLVANSTAKVNAQRAAADAAAARSAASDQTAQQIAQMQQQMQQQIAQMQREMQQQNAQTQQQLQEALSAQQEQNANALQTMSDRVAQQTVTADVTPSQENAIDRGVSAEILVRQQITGQIMTEIENAEVSLKEVKTAMQNSFEYAHCDARGNNCTGPKRVKKWRELASAFLEPYDKTIDDIYDALITAQSVGVDLSQIYAMLDDSCTSWSMYMCPGKGESYFVHYGYTDSKTNEYKSAAPRVCEGEERNGNGYVMKTDLSEDEWKKCSACTWLKTLSETDEIYAGWMDTDKDAKENQRVVACADGALKTSKIFARRTRNKNGAGVVELENLETWLQQTESNTTKDVDENLKYCHTDNVENDIEILKSSISSRTVPAKEKHFCVAKLEKNTANDDLNEDKENCPYIAGTYAICDTHPYNAGIEKLEDSAYQQIEKIREIVGLKVTVISQQMYKQYEYLNATLRRLKTQLEKTVLTSALQVAGAHSDSDSSSAFGRSEDGAIYIAGAENCANMMSSESVYSCLQKNIGLIISSARSNTRKACKQLQEVIRTADTWLEDKVNKTNDDNNTSKCKNIENDCNKNNVAPCAQEVNQKVAKQREKDQRENRRYAGYGYQP